MVDDYRINKDYLVKGKYSIVKQSVQDAIDKSISGCDYFKIGITNDYNVRIGQDDYDGKYEQMFIVYKSKKVGVVDTAEIEMIHIFYNHVESLNIDKKGRGPSGKYLYVVTTIEAKEELNDLNKHKEFVNKNNLYENILEQKGRLKFLMSFDDYVEKIWKKQNQP